MIRALNRFALWLAWLGAPLAALMVLSPWLAGRWLSFEVFSHFAVHGAVYLAALLIATGLRRWFIGAVIAAGILGGAGAFGLPFLIQGQQPDAPPQGGLKVLSFNLHGWVNPDLDSIEALLRKQNADVVLLLEFTRVQSPLFERLRQLYPHQSDCARYALCHLALFSRYPMRGASLKGRPRGSRAPTMARAVINAPEGPVHFIGVHHTRPLDPFGQRDELHYVASEVKKLGGKPVIVAGDFNSVPWSQNVREFQQKSGLNCLNRYTPTWPMDPVPLAQFPIDQICVSTHFTPGSFRALPATGSDHRPVTAGLGM